MAVGFGDLGAKQRCIYDAFKKATQKDGDFLGSAVNAQGYDADDTMAVLILGKANGFVQTPRGCTGKKFKEILKNLEEKTEFIVLVNTGVGSAGGIYPKSVPGKGYQYDFETGFDATPMFNAKEFDEVLWHAIFVSAEAGGKNKVVDDKQGLRPNGPGDRDKIIWLAR